MSGAGAPAEVVVDTSVVFKWFSRDGEDGADEAARLLDAHESAELSLIAPASMPLELANALRYSTVSEAAAMEVVGGLHLAHIEIVDLSSALLAEAMRLAYEHALSIYDAVFLALALDRGCALATSDRRAFAGIEAGVEILLV